MAAAKSTAPHGPLADQEHPDRTLSESVSPTLLTVDEICSATKLSPSTIRRTIRLRHLGVIRIGRAVRVREADLEAWLNRNSHRAR